MIVYIEIPFGAGRLAFRAFRDALGEERVGWLGQTATMADLAAPDAPSRYAVVGGRAALADLASLPGARLFATMVSDPVSRTTVAWAAWRRDARHPLHWLPHTFDLREAFEGAVEEAQPITGAMASHLRPPGASATIDGIVAGLRAMPFLIGFPDHPQAFARMLERRLDLQRSALDVDAFRENGRVPKNAEVAAVITAATVRDRALLARLREARGSAKVLDLSRRRLGLW
ncbi:hypothetical protein [Acuticoccus sp.]|uniref:hypothetical protein n=1 Tax=Acuticoccus sp. TaxID=1904378 RepID=UPI003B52CD81